MGTTGQSITLANSIIGVGILAMPFCFQQCGVLLATLILLSMGLVSRLCCYFLLKSALIARRRNFELLAFHVFGPAGKLAVEVGIIGFLMGTCIAYFVVVGDLGPQIIAKLFNINQSDILRTSIMVIVSLVCVLPLGLLRNVDSLSNVSAATIGFYFCLVMKVIAEAASQLLTGDWHTKLEMWKPSGLLQCVPIFSMALFCQTQLFEIFESLPTLSLGKMNVVTKNAINICTGVYFTLGVFGYIAFCSQNISGNILMSLSPTMASDVIKLGFVMSLAFSFPLIIFPCRASLYSLLYNKVHSSQHDHIVNYSIPVRSFRCITVCIIAVALFISLLIPNIELVLGLVGSTIGVLICVVFPAACFVNVTFKDTNERVLAKAILVLGLVIMVLGTYANLQAADSQHDRFDDKYITKERIDKMVEDFFDKMEKSDEVIAKPLVKNDPIPQVENKQFGKEMIKDSEVQPPNPVPPELSENENGQNVQNGHAKDREKLKEYASDVASEVKNKVSESHPKNLQTKLNEIKTANGDNNENEVNIAKPKEEDIKTQSKEPEIDNINHDEVNIKQNEQAQKDIVQERKEILDEKIKANNEAQKKIDLDPNETKKIAVESIQKIANMAIQSLGGVSEKPAALENADKKSEPLEKLAIEAVHDIAQKAVETIEAIQEIKEKPKEAPASEPEVNKVESHLANEQSKVNPSIPTVVVKEDNIHFNLQNPSPAVVFPIDTVNNLNSKPLPVLNNHNMNLHQQLQSNAILPNIQPVVQNNAKPSINTQPVVHNNGHHAVNMQPNIHNNAQSALNVQPFLQNNAQHAQNVQTFVQNNAQPTLNVQPAVQNNEQQAHNVQPVVQNSARPTLNTQPVVQNNAHHAQYVQPFVNAQPALKVQPVIQNNAQTGVNLQSDIQNNAQPVINVHSGIQNNALPAMNIDPVFQNKEQSNVNVHQVVQRNVLPVVQSNAEQNNNIPPVINTNNAPGVQNVDQTASKHSEMNSNDAQGNANQNFDKAHSHSLDEPQSYKLGEDTQKHLAENNLNNIVQNVPLAVAMNGNTHISNQINGDNNLKVDNAQSKHVNEDEENVSMQRIKEEVRINGAKNRQISDTQPNNAAQVDSVVPRQKREVVDCTKKSSLESQDKKVCENLIDMPQVNEDSVNIPKVKDWQDTLPVKLDLPQNLPVDNIIYNIRSLKSYKELEKKR